MAQAALSSCLDIPRRFKRTCLVRGSGRPQCDPASTKIPFYAATGGKASYAREIALSFNGHNKPFPTWYPYAFIGVIAGAVTAYFVLA
jgi:hypothetical protein